MTATTSSNTLNRFTTLPVLLDMLENRHLVFSDPKFWDDENDTELLKIYQKAKGKKKILALCFLKDHETIHHWKAFADGISGCCIEFDKAKLTELLSARKSDGVRYGSVIYKRIEDACDGSIDDCREMIPFIKRWPYRFEKEFRAIWEGDKGYYKIENVDLTIITKITLSPTIPKPVFNTVKKLFRKDFEILKGIEINHSTVYRNSDWIKKFDGRNQVGKMKS
jgi:hypothetical protein